MELEKYLPQTAEEYIDCFRSLAAMINSSMDMIEKMPVADREDRLNSLAEAINTIGALRGDNDIFLASRPADLQSYQKEMYAIEDTLRARLAQLGNQSPQTV